MCFQAQNTFKKHPKQKLPHVKIDTQEQYSLSLDRKKLILVKNNNFFN
jgi:hypothetical protein